VAPQTLRAVLDRLRGPARGEPGETLACRYLERRGLSILARNFRCRPGEIDIVAREGHVTVFVEVKDRSSASHGSGVEAVTPGKRRRLAHAARLYAATRGLTESPMRFDVVSIERAPDGRAVIRHDRDAFGCD
jgi:putative endonuclease